MARSHDKEYFYKFMPCDTARSVLQNCSLRWKKPSLFNDPFDHQLTFNFPFTQEEFSSSLAAELERLVYNSKETFKEETLLSQMVQQLRESKDRMPKNEIIEILIEGCNESAELFQDYQNNVNSMMRASINQSRVLCVSEKNDNVVMWSHYADSHKGICFRLQCIEEVDTALLAAKPITYTDKFPVFLTLQEQISYLTGIEEIEVGKLIANVAFMKHKDWSYEKEWRIHRPHENNDGEYNDWGEDPRVFGAIYFGCRINDDDKNELINFIQENYAHMEIYQAKPSEKGFKIEYVQIQ